MSRRSGEAEKQTVSFLVINAGELDFIKVLPSFSPVVLRSYFVARMVDGPRDGDGKEGETVKR